MSSVLVEVAITEVINPVSKEINGSQ